MSVVLVRDEAFEARRRTADRIFRGALIFNIALTAFWLFVLLVNRDAVFFKTHEIDRAALGRIAGGVIFFYIVWGFIWGVVLRTAAPQVHAKIGRLVFNEK